jgi:hypothetical protein
MEIQSVDWRPLDVVVLPLGAGTTRNRDEWVKLFVAHRFTAIAKQVLAPSEPLLGEFQFIVTLMDITPPVAINDAVPDRIKNCPDTKFMFWTLVPLMNSDAACATVVAENPHVQLQIT